jgi:hypothetical protein
MTGPTHDSSGRLASGPYHLGSPAEWLVQADFDSWQKSGHAAPSEIHMRSNNGPLRLLQRLHSHLVVVHAAAWGDDVRLSDLEPKYTCKARGRRGADVRLLFEKAAMGIRLKGSAALPALGRRPVPKLNAAALPLAGAFFLPPTRSA